MMFKSLSLLALASSALAQQSNVTLQQALSSSSDLSQLNQVLQLNPELVAALNGARDITILAPSNRAFSQVPNATLQGLLGNSGAISALLQYHVLNGTYRSSAITTTGAFVPTLLTNPMYTNVTGGQRVKAQLVNGNVTFFSGLLDNSTVTQANVNFTGGVIHVIDRLLTVPVTASDTLTAAGLTSLRGALVATNLVDTVNYTPNVTIFAPTNAALQSIGSGLANLTTQQLTDVLTYHVVAGTLGYSSGLANNTVVQAANGGNLTVTIGQEGRIFVNNARVVIADVLIANGVVHVIDAVLNPTNASIANPSATAGAPAYSGASSVSNAPFTSGQPTATRSISSGATSAANPAGSSAPPASTGAAPMQTGAVGIGALFGAAALYFM